MCNWPSWRFGHVIESRTSSGARCTLSVQQAQEVGKLFSPGSEGVSGEYYRTHRVSELDAIAGKSGGRVTADFGGSLSTDQARFVHILPDITVQYRYVPMVAMPRFLLESGPCRWLIREGVTVCAASSRSKAWLHCLLIDFKGKSTLENGLSPEELSDVREGLDEFVAEARDTFLRFYKRVLTEDIRKLNLHGILADLSSFVPVADVEIVAVAAKQELDRVFDHMERYGLRSAIAFEQSEFGSSVRSLKRFCDWVESKAEGFVKDGSDHSSDKQLLSIPADDVVGSFTKAFVLSHAVTRPDGIRAEFDAILAGFVPVEGPKDFEVSDDETPRPSAPSLANQVAAHFVANEYGRSY